MSAGKLPEGWVDTQLGNVIEYGKTSKKDLSDVNGETWVLELEDIEKDSSKILNKVIASNRPFKSTKNSFKKGDVLYGKLRPYLNKVIMANDDGVCTTEIIPINAEPACCNKYLFFWLKSSTFLGYVSDVSYGVNMPRLGTSDGLKAPLRLAPLVEQKIIAEKLDTLLAQVDSTKARLEQIPKILKRFRQAVLGAAMNGTLMEIHESRPHPLCDQWQWPGIPSTWSVLTYSELVDSRLGKMLDKVKNTGVPIKYLGNVNVRWFSFNLKNLQEILISESELNELNLKKNDVLICEGGEPGRCAIWSGGEREEVIFQKALHRARVSEKITPEWLVLNLKNDSNNLMLSQLFTGTTIKHLTGKSLAKYPLRVPPVDEQYEIVRRVEQLFAYADTVEKQVNNALSRVNNLTQSILAKAFRGELTAQWRAENPELISGENSAAALLDKIKAERAASTGKKPSRKKS